jgi:hypothetical protein
MTPAITKDRNELFSAAPSFRAQEPFEKFKSQ